MDKIIWQTKEYEYKAKTPDWYWALGIIAVSGVVISIIYRNYLFAIFIILATIILTVHSHKVPETLEIEIGKKGVKIRKEFHSYETIKAFWIENFAGGKRLLLSSKAILMPIIVLPIEEISEDEVRAMLLGHLKE